MSDYMKEVERLLIQYENAYVAVIDMSVDQARAALLAHIQRGAVPVYCTPTEHEGRIVYEHTSEPIPNADGFVLYAASADQFRTAAKMMAVQPACMTCTAPAPAEPERQIGPASDADMVVYQSIADGYARDTALAPAEVPMPEPAHKFFHEACSVFLAYTANQMQQFGEQCRAAGEAAGYARGLAEGAARTGLTPAEHDVLAERQRQISAEGWTPEHDDGYGTEELAFAAACYCTADEDEAPPSVWPWDISWWKPTTRRRNCVKAAALLLAEIERLDRAALRGEVKP